MSSLLIDCLVYVWQNALKFFCKFCIVCCFLPILLIWYICNYSLILDLWYVSAEDKILNLLAKEISVDEESIKIVLSVMLGLATFVVCLSLYKMNSMHMHTLWCIMMCCLQLFTILLMLSMI